jgi:hypothetical protein
LKVVGPCSARQDDAGSRCADGLGRLSRLPQHPDEHRPQCPVLLTVDQQFGEGAALRVAPELSDSIGSLEVGERQDAEQFGAGSGAEGVEAFPELAFELIGPHC